MKAKIKITEEKPGKGKIEGVVHLTDDELVSQHICPDCTSPLRVKVTIRKDKSKETLSKCHFCGFVDIKIQGEK